MSSETITRNDLKNILNEVLPNNQEPPVVAVDFRETLTSKTTGGKTASATIDVPSGYEVIPNCRPVSPFISGEATVMITDRGFVTMNGSTASFSYYLYNPNGKTNNMILYATILCRKKTGSNQWE